MIDYEIVKELVVISKSSSGWQKDAVVYTEKARIW